MSEQSTNLGDSALAFVRRHKFATGLGAAGLIAGATIVPSTLNLVSVPAKIASIVVCAGVGVGAGIGLDSASLYKWLTEKKEEKKAAVEAAAQ